MLSDRDEIARRNIRYLSTGSSSAFQGSWVSPVGAFDSGWLANFNDN